MSIIHFLADAITTAPASGPATPAAPGPVAPWWAKLFGNNMFPIILGMIIILMFMSRSKKNGEKERLAALKELKRGDRIQTIGGILGSVLRVEENRIEVKVDETNNTKMWFTRNAIHRVIDEDKDDVK